MELLQGTLDVLVLRGLTWGPKHGCAVARWISHISDGSLTILDGALYAALHRMEERGWIAAEWGVSPQGRRAKFYCLAPTGRKRLRIETQSWTEYADAVGRILRTTVEPT